MRQPAPFPARLHNDFLLCADYILYVQEATSASDAMAAFLALPVAAVQRLARFDDSADCENTRKLLRALAQCVPMLGNRACFAAKRAAQSDDPAEHHAWQRELSLVVREQERLRFVRFQVLAHL